MGVMRAAIKNRSRILNVRSFEKTCLETFTKSESWLEMNNTVQRGVLKNACWTVFLVYSRMVFPDRFIRVLEPAFVYVTNPGPSNAPETAARIRSAIASGSSVAFITRKRSGSRRASSRNPARTRR